MNTYVKLRDGTWGIRYVGTTPPASGTVVAVVKRDGVVKRETVGRLIWRGTDQDGNGVALFSVAPTAPTRRRWKPCGYPGCTYGQHCDECEGEGG